MKNFNTTIIGLVLILSACGESEDATEMPQTEQVTEPQTASVDNSIVYASDPNARFEILSTKRLPNGNIEVLNKRIGPSGVSFSRREISCSKYTYRYLGEGDTLDDAMKNDVVVIVITRQENETIDGLGRSDWIEKNC